MVSHDKHRLFTNSTFSSFCLPRIAHFSHWPSVALFPLRIWLGRMLDVSRWLCGFLNHAEMKTTTKKPHQRFSCSHTYRFEFRVRFVVVVCFFLDFNFLVSILWR